MVTPMSEISTQLSEVQRALGRVEGAQEELLNKMNAIIESFVRHEESDRVEFSASRAALASAMRDLNAAREAQFAGLQASIDELKADRAFAKGAGWVIVAILGACVTFIGSAVVGVLRGTIKFH